MRNVSTSSPAKSGLGDAAVSVRDVSVDFDGTVAVANASFDLAQGRFLTILGPSGSGKTTLLRMIAGFLTPSSGAIFVAGQPVDRLPPHRRSIGMVFQKLALFPHMTAAQNVAFPLKMRRHDARTIAARVDDFLDLVRLGGLGGRRVGELSGGQQQRVAIARALVFEPDLLLLDEPLAALDRKLREEMQLEFRRIQRELGVTTINVTHDQREALVVSDEVIVMDHGVIQQAAPPSVLYREPANEFVSGFIGVSSVLNGTVGPGATLLVGDVACPGRTRGLDAVTGTPARGMVRAEQIRMATEARTLTDLDVTLPGTVQEAIFEGERRLYSVQVPALGGAVLQVLHHDPLALDLLAPGTPVHLGWRASDLLILSATAA
ncbi:ABC transporter ATP-binding protein [Pseudoruegeria sp. SK021]|uniref:ABC transporter ATP-binding protein n=1 Tax=Pseudoruegeria sp. SK021 TaxID=1933035 RepID=UPI000A261BF4|nr:ABC transporter ATP-binding protein [Pseudoruegeria sp. SK021]OSP54810.1 polyamine ABC transporter ATP-binding protein [Pseudoruegeria sp. SK021]